MRPSYQRRLLALEAQYNSLLRDALRHCANGHWGLLSHNEIVFGRARSDLINLSELAAEIEQLRQRLGYTDAFALHERLMRMRSSTDSNTLGEPILAQQWLEEMDSSVQD
jgi:hypothetical protein